MLKEPDDAVATGVAAEDDVYSGEEHRVACEKYTEKFSLSRYQGALILSCCDDIISLGSISPGSGLSLSELRKAVPYMIYAVNPHGVEDPPSSYNSPSVEHHPITSEAHLKLFLKEEKLDLFAGLLKTRGFFPTNTPRPYIIKEILDHVKRALIAHAPQVLEETNFEELASAAVEASEKRAEEKRKLAQPGARFWFENSHPPPPQPKRPAAAAADEKLGDRGPLHRMRLARSGEGGDKTRVPKPKKTIAKKSVNKPAAPPPESVDIDAPPPPLPMAAAVAHPALPPVAPAALERVAHAAPAAPPPPLHQHQPLHPTVVLQMLMQQMQQMQQMLDLMRQQLGAHATRLGLLENRSVAQLDALNALHAAVQSLYPGH